MTLITNIRPSPTAASAEFERIRNRIRTSKNPRLALFELRESSPDVLLRMGGRFATHPAYKNLIWRAPFPGTLTESPPRGYPYYLPLAQEVAWSTSVIVSYAKQLNIFLDLKSKFDSNFLTGDIESARNLLSSIRLELGESLWYAQNTIAVDARDPKLSRSDYARSIIQNSAVSSNLRQIVAWFNYKFNPTVSRVELQRLLSEAAPLRFAVDYLIHNMMGEFPKVDLKTASEMISHTDHWPAIDRYLQLIAILQLIDPLDPMEADVRSVITASLALLSENIDDAILARLCLVWNVPTATITQPPPINNILEYYSRGDYSRVLRSVSEMDCSDLTIEAVHIATRAAALSSSSWSLASPRDDLRGLIHEIAADLVHVVNFAEAGVEARLRLQKHILNHANTAWASSLALILLRQENDERAFSPTREQSLHSLKAAVDHPLMAFALPGQGTAARYLEQLMDSAPDHITSRLLASLGSRAPEDEGMSQIPAERLALVDSLRDAKQGNYSDASRQLQSILKMTTSELASRESQLLLVGCRLAQGELAAAADVAASLFVHSRYFGLVLPIRALVAALLNGHNEPLSISPTRGKVSVAIVFDVYSRYVSSDRDAERADAYKDVLRRLGIDRASEIPALSVELPHDELVYFLRYICVPDVLDQSLALESTREVEDERAAILVALSEMTSAEDRAPPSAFKDELRDIRTRQVVRDTTLRLDQSKIYVNIEGIRRALDVTLRELWNRYRFVRSNGADGVDFGQITQIVKTKLGEKVTVITLGGPLTEHYTLFHRMISELRDQFAFSKEFGLNSNLSTNIRHGYVLREIRGPLVARNLITNKDSESGSYIPNSFWTDRLPDQHSTAATLSELLSDFSSKIDEQVESLNRDLLRIRSDSTPYGLFNYGLHESVLRAVEPRWGALETYEEFVEVVFESFWASTEDNLANVRDTLLGPILHNINEHLNSLEKSIRQSDIADLLPGIESAISMVRPDIRSSVERIASWFTLSGNNEYQDFDLEIPFQAGLQTIKTYYSNLDIHASYVSNEPIVLRGWCLPFFGRLIFQLLDNAAYHGSKNRTALEIKVSAEVTTGILIVKVESDLPDNYDMDRLTRTVTNINKDYGRDKAIDRLGEEGGSGFPKIWKLLHVDLRRDHELLVSLRDNKFTVEILMSSYGIS